ncbi:MAG: 50S ribosomal protein L24 [Verrucomicrobiia bacterium]
MKSKIRKGDHVIVLTGKDKGKTGEILRVDLKENRVVVQGVNQVKRHRRATAMSASGIETKEAPIHVSNVAHVDPKSGKATRVGVKLLGDGKKVLVARKSGETIERKA